MMGDRANKGVKQKRPVKKRFFNLTRRTTVAKNSPCPAPPSCPNIPGSNLIVAGDVPSPPK